MITLRCSNCGNAVRRPVLQHESGAKEVVSGSCPLCDDGGQFDQIFITAQDGREMNYLQWMDFRGLEP
jgi:hypothetical protein